MNDLGLLLSSVQRVLDARGQRGSWMPTSKKNFLSIHLQKVLTIFFYRNLYIIFLTHLPKIMTTFFSKLLSGCPLLSWMPPYPGCPGQSTFFSYFLCIYPYFFTFMYTFF